MQLERRLTISHDPSRKEVLSKSRKILKLLSRLYSFQKFLLQLLFRGGETFVQRCVLNNFVKKKKKNPVCSLPKKKKTGNSISNGHEINPGKVRFNVQIQNGFFPNKTEINTTPPLYLQQTLFSSISCFETDTPTMCIHTESTLLTWIFFTLY